MFSNNNKKAIFSCQCPCDLAFTHRNTFANMKINLIFQLEQSSPRRFFFSARFTSILSDLASSLRIVTSLCKCAFSSLSSLFDSLVCFNWSPRVFCMAFLEIKMFSIYFSFFVISYSNSFSIYLNASNWSSEIELTLLLLLLVLSLLIYFYDPTLGERAALFGERDPSLINKLFDCDFLVKNLTS